MEEKRNIAKQDAPIPHWGDPDYMEYMLKLESNGHFDSQRVLIDAEEERSQKRQTFDSYAKSQTFNV